MAANYTIKWRAPKAFKEIFGDVEKNMGRAAAFASGEAKKLVSRGQPRKRLKSGRMVGLQPSLPGEPYKTITGGHRAAILSAVDKSTLIIRGLIGYPKGPYTKSGRALELGSPRMAARPHLRRAVLENAIAILDIISGRR